LTESINNDDDGIEAIRSIATRNNRQKKRDRERTTTTTTTTTNNKIQYSIYLFFQKRRKNSNTLRDFYFEIFHGKPHLFYANATVNVSQIRIRRIFCGKPYKMLIKNRAMKRILFFLKNQSHDLLTSFYPSSIIIKRERV
jgi:hypothetical protein